MKELQVDCLQDCRLWTCWAGDCPFSFKPCPSISSFFFFFFPKKVAAVTREHISQETGGMYKWKFKEQVVRGGHAFSASLIFP